MRARMPYICMKVYMNIIDELLWCIFNILAFNILHYLVSATSATSHVVLGQFKTCVILLGGFLLFQANPGPKSICGATMALSGMAMYTFLNLQHEGSDVNTKQSSHKSLGFSILKPQSKVNKSFLESSETKQATDSVWKWTMVHDLWHTLHLLMGSDKRKKDTLLYSK